MKYQMFSCRNSWNKQIQQFAGMKWAKNINFMHEKCRYFSLGVFITITVVINLFK